VVASDEKLSLAKSSKRHPPELATFDRYGRRLDEVRFHPAYHQLMTLAMRHRVHDIAWSETRPGRHLAHAVLLALFTQAEAGTMCPINMTYASVAALRHGGEAADALRARLVGGHYYAPLRPIADKAGVTVGMAMTEKQGGSDVRANTTRAVASNEGADTYRLTGHKWFCSAPMSDAFLTLAQTASGLSCFLLPRITPDGERNRFQLMRLKDKLGNRSNASAEVEYHDAFAILLGEEGRGIATIIDMVHHTRLGTMAATLGLMRMGLAQALHHIGHRRAFGRLLGEQPAMQAVVADLVLEYEAAVLLTTRVAIAFDAEDGEGRAFARLAMALGKFWLTKRNPSFIFECMECLGGAGYIEESPMPRLFRESPLNAIWEGSGNVIALDILRTLGREPAALALYRAELAAARGGNAHLDAAMAGLEPLLASADEARARLVAERLALLLQGALMVRHAPAAIADAFCATRLAGEWGRVFGTLPEAADVNAILARQHG
jgi:putative acyl-CoA dehydrogenase